MRVAVLSMSPSNACELLEVLVNMWQSRFDAQPFTLVYTSVGNSKLLLFFFFSYFMMDAAG